MEKIKYTIYVLVLTIFSSCNKYLDQMPDDRTIIDSPEKVKELLVTAYPSSTYMSLLEPMTDNVGDKSELAYLQTLTNEESYFWKEVTNTQQDTPEHFWASSYEAISAANHALETINASNNQVDFSALKGEALITRAYNHFMLVNLFSKRYNVNTASDELGIPYVLKPEKVVFGSYERGTIQHTYEMIQRDLEEGLTLIEDGLYDVPKYHFSENAAFAFASRFYLTIGDWEKAYYYANRVLGPNPTSFLRDWHEYDELNYYELRNIYTKYTESANILLSGAITLLGRYNGIYRYGLTYDIYRNIFRSNATGGELLYKVFGSETTLNIPKFEEHFKYSSINATTGLPYVMAPLFTVEEVLFNRMEASVMLNNYEDVIADINTFYSKRIKDYDPTIHIVDEEKFEDHYTKASVIINTPEIDTWYVIDEKQRLYIKGILDIKRIEFLQEGQRWFDIKRYNIEVVREDEDGMVLDILKKDDPRRAIQIPKPAIAEGIEANPM
jgi:hypothetical protein